MQFKPYFTGILALFVAFTLSAEILSPEQALERARTSQSVDSRLQKRITPGNVRLIQTIDNARVERPLCYVFSHNLSDEGFTIVAADDRVDPVIGYGDSAFDPTNIPPGLEYMLDFYSQELESLDDPMTPRKARRANEQVRPNYDHIPTLMKSTWDQSAPYWNKCPTYNGERCVTGCVATAMAQVMYFHKHPTKGTGSHSYYWTNPSNTTQKLSMNFADTTFDWNNMLDNYKSGAYTTTQGTAVATLMSACGISIDMGYNISSNGGSGAFTQDVVTALRTYFDYSPNCRYVNRGSMSLLQFEEVVYQSLTDDGPVIFSGSNSSGGHCFVCDGYSYNGFFHINWGWGGTSDGYFRLSVLDPDVQGIGGSAAGYNDGQGIIIGIHPKQDGETYTPYYSAFFRKDFALKTSTGATSANLGSQVLFDATFYSSSSETISRFYIGVKFVNQATEAVSYSAYSTYYSNLKPNYGGSNQTISVNIPSGLAAGYYTVTPVFFVGSVSKANMYDFDIEPKYIQSVTMLVSNGKAYFQPDVVEPTITNVTFNTDIYASQPFSITLEFENENDKDFVGLIYPVLYNEDGSLNGTYTGFPINLLAGEKFTYDYEAAWGDLTVGETYKIAFGLKFNNNTSITLLTPMYQVTITDTPAEDFEYDIANVSFEGLEGVGMHQLTCSFDLLCSSGVGCPYFQPVIFDATTGYVIGYSTVEYAISKDKIRHISMPIGLKDDSAIEPGKQYYCVIQSTTDYGDNWTENYRSFINVDNVTGVLTIASDPDTKVTREYYDTMGRRIDADNLTPGLYIERIVNPDGTVTTTKRLKN